MYQAVLFQVSDTADRLHSVAQRYRFVGPWRAPNVVARQQTTRRLVRRGRQATLGIAAGGARDHRMQRLETVLFLAREPLSTRKLSQFAGLADGTEARTLVGRLNELYDRQGRAFRVEEVAGGYQLLSRRQFAPWLRRLGHVPNETRLSGPAMETLAVVAYRQPVLRADVEAIRGVNCGEILRQLMERDLVRIGGRSEELGRPYLYTTTKRFLQTFGLRDVEGLPRADFMRGALASQAASPEDQDDSAEEFNDELDERQTEEESDVKVTIPMATQLEQQSKRARRQAGKIIDQSIDDDDDDYGVDDDEDLDDDDEWDDDDDDLDDDDIDDEDIDDDFDDEGEWEEVEDDEYDDDDDEWDDDDDDDDWDDDDD